MQNDELLQLLKETIDFPPSQTTLDIYSFQKKHATQTIRLHGDYIKYFEVYFDLLNLFISKMNYAPKDSWPPYKGLLYIFYPETIKTLHRAFEDITQSYYDEATILLRCVFEYYIRMIYVAAHPSDISSSIMKIFSSKGKDRLNITSFLKDDLKTSWHEFYSIMSTISHSKAHKILKKCTELPMKKKEPITLHYYYSEHDISMPINISTFLLYLLIHLLLVCYKDDLTQPFFSKDEVERLNKTDAVLRGIIDNMPNEFPTRVKDIINIDRIFA